MLKNTRRFLITPVMILWCAAAALGAEADNDSQRTAFPKDASPPDGLKLLSDMEEKNLILQRIREGMMDIRDKRYDDALPKLEWVIKAVKDASQTKLEQEETDKKGEDADQNPVLLKMYEAMINVQDKEYATAIPKLEWVIDADPTQLEAWATLGWAYWTMGRKDETAKLWQRMVNIAPNEPQGYNLLAQLATHDLDLTLAKELYQKSLKLNPQQFETRVSLAKVMLWAGEFIESEILLHQLFKEDPDRLDVEIDLAWSMYANEKYEEVIDIWNHVNDVMPDNPGFMLARAEALLLIGSLVEAQAEAIEILDLDKDNRGALNLLVNVARHSRHPHETVAALRRVQDLAEGDVAKANIAMEIAGYMKHINDLDPTIFTMTDCLKAAEDVYDYGIPEVQHYLFYAELLVKDKRFRRAEEVFREVLDKLNPFNQRSHEGIFECYMGRTMLDEAEAKLTENLRMFNPNNPFRHLQWARLRFDQGNYPAALDALDRLEYEGAKGAVFVVLYHGLSPSEWSDMISVRQFRDHLMALRRAGFKFITPLRFDDYFSKRPDPPPLSTIERPLLMRLVQGVKRAWTGELPEKTERLIDYTPDLTVCITMDDGLRNSFRYGAIVMDEMLVPITMFVPAGGVLTDHHYTCSFQEIREYITNELWEIHSHLWDAGYTSLTKPEGHPVNPIPNLLWLPEEERLESLREYHARLRHEFRDTKRILARELNLDPTNIIAVAYPIGDIGQETVCNIDFFDVPEVILNEAEISHSMGFIQGTHGYAMATDDPMLYKRYEPSRTVTGRDVLREAFLQHPIYAARRMRAEIAALNGQLHLANRMVEVLKRDGYPDEDLAEVNAMIKERLARLIPAPDSEITAELGKDTWFDPRHPYAALEGNMTKANVMIDEWHAEISAGLDLNPQWTFGLRAGLGGIKQTVTSNHWYEVEKTTVTSSRSDVRVIEDGVETHQEERRTTYETTMVQTNKITEYKYKLDETMVGANLTYVHEHGSLSMGQLRYRSFKGDELEDESGRLVFSLEHQWRPVPAIDMSCFYTHDLVPSARELMEYDGLSLRAIWRVKDWWEAQGLGSFFVYDDDNSFLHTNVENLWRLTPRHNVWFGIHNSLDTVDRNSDLYWTPYWEQRHFLILRLAHSYPRYFGMLRFHLGLQRDEARSEEKEIYNNARVQGEAEGWYPGESPSQGWGSLLGMALTVNRRWDNGWDFSGEFSVNAVRDYTEYTVSGKLMYRF